MVRAEPGFLSPQTACQHRGNSFDTPEAGGRRRSETKYAPALATDKVAAVSPLDSIGAGSVVLVVDSAAVVGPERVVVVVAVPSAAGGSCAGDEPSVARLRRVKGNGQSAGSAEEEGLEGNHVDGGVGVGALVLVDELRKWKSK